MSITEYHLQVRGAVRDDGADTLQVDLRRRIDDWTSMRLDPLPDVPRHTVELPEAHTATARAARNCPEALLQPGALTHDFATLTAWLWNTALSGPMRALLCEDAAHLRIVLTATGDAAVLPWETILDQPTLAARTTAGRIELIREPSQEPNAPARSIPLRRSPVRRRALVLIGSTLQRQDLHDPHAEIHTAIASLRAAGFDVLTVCGHPAIVGDQLPTPLGGLHIDERLTCPPHLADDERRQRLLSDLERILRRFRPAIVHTFGHSNASLDPRKADPLGGSALRLDLGGEFPLDLPIADFARVLRLGHARVAILAACDLRERVAEQLFDRGGAEHVVTMSGFVAPAHACIWSQAFYAGLGSATNPTRSVRLALANARAALPEPVRWLPWHHASHEAALAVTGDDDELVEEYCSRLARLLRVLEGRFRGTGWVFGDDQRDVYVELGVRDRERESRTKLDDRDDPRLFAHLFDLHTRRFLLSGNLGAGKSTTLRMYARELAEDTLRSRVPVFVSLSTWLQPTRAERDAEHLDAPPLLAHVARSLLGRDCPRTVAALERLEREGRLVILLDGLDELGRAARAALEHVLAAQFERCRIVVSTRRYEHTGTLRDFFDVDLEPLTPARAEELFTALLTRHRRLPPHGLSDAERQERIRTWRDRFQHGPRVWQELGRVPLFVTLIAELVGDRKEPGDTKAAFFDSVLAHLCVAEHRGPRDADFDKGHVGSSPLVEPDPSLRGSKQKLALHARVRDVLDVLAEIALRMTQAATVEAPRHEVLRWIEAADQTVADALDRLELDATDFLDRVHQRSEILLPDLNAAQPKPSDDNATWRFWHRSFQEALTAWAIERRLNKENLLDSIVEIIDLEPPGAVTRQAQELVEKWREDIGRMWPDLYEATVISEGPALDRLFACFDRAAGIWDANCLQQSMAAILGPVRTRQVRQDYWIAPTSLLAARIRERCAPRWQREGTVAPEKLIEGLGNALLIIDPELGRRAVATLDTATPDLLRTALLATTHSDAKVDAASTGRELWFGLTTRLREREPLYTEAPRLLREDPVGLSRVLVERAETVDDPGELFLIALAAQRMKDGPDRWAVETAIDTRLEARSPDPVTWADHFALLPGGIFRQGSQQGETRERPVHKVELSPFHIGRTPITVRLYRQFWPEHRMEIDGEVDTLAAREGQNMADDESWDDLPVTYVSWFAARMFCRWLWIHREALPAELRELTPTLPTESQAERSIRAGEDGEFWFGSEADAPEAAWFASNSGGRPHAVGRKRANGLGLFDVGGNVVWWCLDAYRHDAYGERAGRIDKDPIVPGPCAASRVVRGGSFGGAVRFLRSAFRSWVLPASADGFLGFRVALVAAPPELGSALDDR